MGIKTVLLTCDNRAAAEHIGSAVAVDEIVAEVLPTEKVDIARAINLSRLTIRNIKQNLFWAFFYNVLGIPIAAKALYPSLELLLSSMIGAFAMSLSSLFVVSNALKLRIKQI